MARIESSIDAIEMMGGITAHIRMKRGNELKFRLWLGCIFIRLGVWIAGMKSSISIETESADT